MNEFIEDKIEKLLSNEGLSDWTEEVIRTLVPCLVLEPQEEDNIPKGTSKWGGAPDLPPETPYPMDALQPLTFIAQFNLTELKEQDPMSPLPDRGMLYFFAGSNDLYHRAPSDRITCQVIYADVHPDELIPAPFPDDLPREAVVTERGIRFRMEKTFPNVDAPEEMEEMWFELMDQLYELEERKGAYHQAFGPPFSLQEDVFDVCRSYEGQLATEWVLLLQVDSDEEMVWGDEGMLYFCLPREALLRGDFSKTCLVIQNP